MWEYFAKKPSRRERRAARPKSPYWYNTNFTLEDVCFILQQHPAGCVFELDAPHNILARLSSKSKDEWMNGRNTEELKQCFIQSEIYCPHEGVDRRAEYGVL